MPEEQQLQTEETQTTAQEKTTPGLDIFFNKKQFSLIQGYKKIHRFIFKYGIFVGAILLGLGIGYYLQNHKTSLTVSIVDKDSPTINSYTLQYKQRLPNIQEEQIKVILAFGTLIHTDRYLESWNNLISYQDLILPKSFRNEKDKIVFNITNFNEGNYTAEDIHTLLEELIYASSNSSPKYYNNSSLPLPNGILKDFKLECLTNTKISSLICNKLLEKFYEGGMYYPLNQYPQEVSTIFQNINDKEPLCKLLNTNALYTNSTTTAVGSLMYQCSSEEYQRYTLISNFLEIENELNRGYFSKKVYSSAELNAYKLGSIQQILYRNILSGILNKVYINSYLDFVQELVSKDNGEGKHLDSIYKDMLYYFNNYLLLHKLETHDNKTIDKSEINQLINRITTINKGNSILGIPGLEKQLKTPNIIQEKEVVEVIEEERAIGQLVEELILRVGNRLKVLLYTINEEEQSVNIQTEILSDTILQVDNQSVKASITLIRNKELLYVQNIHIVNEATLNEVIDIHLQNYTLTLNQLLTLIDENFAYYHTSTSDQARETLCDIAESQGSINLIACNEWIIDFFKEGINYTLTIEDELIKDISISDKNLEENIRSSLEERLITKNTSITILKELLNLEIIEEVEERNIEKKIIISERMKDYFATSVVIQDIENDDDTFKIDFTLGEFKLTATYTSSTNTLSRIYYVINEESTLLIRGLEIPLTEENKEDIAHISNNPRAFFYNFSKAAFERYEKMLTEEQ